MIRLRVAGVRQFDTAWSYAWREMRWERWRRSGKREWEAVLIETEDAWRDAWNGERAEMAEAFRTLAAAPRLTPGEWVEHPPERSEAELADLVV
jgi:hypothetical protein